MLRPLSVLLTLALACGPSPGGGDDDDATPDASVDGSGGPDAPDTGANAAVYAHTASTLFRIHPLTYAITRVGDFQWPGASDQMTDIAIDKDGLMIGISYGKVYRVDPDTAACTLLSASLAGMFNGLSFVPASLASGVEGADVLVGTRNTDGQVFAIDPMTGAAAPIGDMGGGFTSSGDIVAVTGFGMVATVPTGVVGPDQLVRLAPITFAATPIGASTGFDRLWGVGYWGTRVFGFSERGDLTVIDRATGVGTLVAGGGETWWGAAVTTAAPIVD